MALTARGPGGTDTLIRTNYIVVVAPVVAAFSGTPTSGVAPLTVTFANLSSGATSYSWAFGDGKTSTTANPSNTYSNAGTYSVALTAVRPRRHQHADPHQLHRGDGCATGGGFAADPTNGVAPLTVTFTNLSSGATDYAWDFSDGHLSTQAAPANVYTNPGTYSVSLTRHRPRRHQHADQDQLHRSAGSPPVADLRPTPPTASRR